MMMIMMIERAFSLCSHMRLSLMNRTACPLALQVQTPGIRRPTMRWWSVVPLIRVVVVVVVAMPVTSMSKNPIVGNYTYLSRVKYSTVAAGFITSHHSPHFQHPPISHVPCFLSNNYTSDSNPDSRLPYSDLSISSCLKN